MRPRWLWLGTGLLAAAVGLGATVVVFQIRAERAALEQAKDDMRAGRLAGARRQLVELAQRHPGRGEIEFHLGVCELALGRVEPALAAFGRVPPDSEHAGWAAVHRAGVEVKRGRLDEAESLYAAGLARPGAHVPEACWELMRLLRLEGRFDEARHLFQAHFGAFPDAAKALRDLYRIDVDPYPAEGVLLFLETAARQAPEDDRVWLGLAALATRSGDFARAEEWLKACLARRPDDPAVWRQRLALALAEGRPDAAREALQHVPADIDAEARAASIRAWFAAREGDRAAERAALEAWLAREPAEPEALGRLAELEIADGRTDRAAELRRRKADLESTRNEYTQLLRSDDYAEHPGELAHLAEALGRDFDASRWEAIAAHTSETAPSPTSRTVDTQARSLADLLPDLKPPSSPLDPRPRSEAPAARVAFVDDAEAVGLRFTHESGSTAGRLIPPVTASGGVGLLDYDQDGWLDVYVAQSGTFPTGSTTSGTGDRQFRNRGDGRFEDATESVGLGGSRGYGHGVAVGDYDNDGHPDLFVTRWRSYALYRNRGDGTFEDVTEVAGLGGDRDWPTSAAFADLDGDSDLDLYVCHYLKWDESDPRTCVDPTDPTRYSCSPRDFEAMPDHLFRNDGGRFADVTQEAGIVDLDGRGFGVVAADLDGDGLVDLFVANDASANYLFRNLGGLKFEEVGHSAGVAANASGGYQAGMGVACGDLDGDGQPDLAVTNYYNESTSFFQNLGHGLFADHTAAIGLAATSRHRLGFGVAMPDVDNDGWLDLLTVNGHIHDGRPQFPWKMPAQLLRGIGSGRVRDITAEAGAPLLVEHIARGLAIGDLDNDGRVDAVVQAQDEPLVYLHNRSDAGSALTLLLEGTASNRDAVGAVVTVEAGGRRRVATRLGGGSYQSAGDPRLHFGLGDAKRADRVEVRWPSGRVDHFEGLAAGTGHLLREGEPSPRPLPGWVGDVQADSTPGRITDVPPDSP
jgi:thioredoxin-like negative regulator of GroEL